MMATLTHLPPEILHSILSYVDAEDLARIPLACQCLHNFVKGNNALCRAIYLRTLDEPPARDLDFEQELHDLVALQALCIQRRDSLRAEDISAHLPFVYRTVTRLLDHAVKVPPPSVLKDVDSAAPLSKRDKVAVAARKSRAQTFPTSRNALLLTSLFHWDAARSAFLCRSFLYERGRALGMPGMGRSSSGPHHPNTTAPEPEDDDDDDPIAGPSTSTSTAVPGASPGPNHDPNNNNSNNLRRSPRLLLRHRLREDGTLTLALDPRDIRSHPHDFHLHHQQPPELRTPRRARVDYQMSAKLHCLYGWGLELDEDGHGGGGGGGSGSGPSGPSGAEWLRSGGAGARGRVDAEARRRAMWRARQGGGAYALACAKVYDLREYTQGTKWGPFLDGDLEGEGQGEGDGAEEGDGVAGAGAGQRRLVRERRRSEGLAERGREEGGEGNGGGVRGLRVDWEKVEAILLVLGTNIRSKGLERFPIFWHFWGKPFAGCWEGSYIPWTRDREQGKGKGKEKEKDKATLTEEEEEKKREAADLDRRDPYGVAGSWLRVVSFLDYSDFFTFNFPIVDRLPRDVPRPPLDVGQATRLILMRIRVSAVEAPGPGDHPDHPVVHFDGFSRALDGSWDENADSNLRGTVRTTPEGEVRWTSSSIFDGEERWRSEGVQVGGVRSARGVVGNWFDKDYNPQGPCGPTAFWKISDREFSGEETPQVLLEDLFPLIADDLEEELADRDSSGDESDLEALDPFGADWAEYELEDELDGLYYFDEEDIFDADDVQEGGILPGEEVEEGGEGEDDDDDEDLDTGDEVVITESMEQDGEDGGEA